MKYLARSVRGGPLKDHRLVAFDGEQGTLRYGTHRDPDAQGKPHRAELTLSTEEFVRRWSEHVPVPGVHRVRAWGRYASPQRQKLEWGREQRPEEEEALPETLRVVKEEPPRDRDHPWEQCPVCHQQLVVTQVLPRAGAPPARYPRAAAA